MRFGRRREDSGRRRPRATAFRSTDLVRELRGVLGPWLGEQGFKRLGGKGWVRPEGEEHLILAVQCRQSGWDPRAGSSFVVELERAATPTRATGFTRRRLWALLDDAALREVLDLNVRVARTLPPPDPAFLSALTANVREFYLRSFAPAPATPDDTDVWFAYYDETDVVSWAHFLARQLPAALERFLVLPPGFFDEGF